MARDAVKWMAGTLRCMLRRLEEVEKQVKKAEQRLEDAHRIRTVHQPLKVRFKDGERTGPEDQPEFVTPIKAKQTASDQTFQDARRADDARDAREAAEARKAEEVSKARQAEEAAHAAEEARKAKEVSKARQAAKARKAADAAEDARKAEEAQQARARKEARHAEEAHKAMEARQAEAIAESRKAALEGQESVQTVLLDVCLEDGSQTPCRGIIDIQLQLLTLRMGDDTAQVPFAGIKEICSGNELRAMRLTKPYDTLCVPLVMQDDVCVTFKFADVQIREHFATCMKELAASGRGTDRFCQGCRAGRLFAKGLRGRLDGDVPLRLGFQAATADAPCEQHHEADRSRKHQGDLLWQ